MGFKLFLLGSLSLSLSPIHLCAFSLCISSYDHAVLWGNILRTVTKFIANHKYQVFFQLRILLFCHLAGGVVVLKCFGMVIQTNPCPLSCTFYSDFPLMLVNWSWNVNLTNASECIFSLLHIKYRLYSHISLFEMLTSTAEVL